MWALFVDSVSKDSAVFIESLPVLKRIIIDYLQIAIYSEIMLIHI